MVLEQKSGKIRGMSTAQGEEGKGQQVEVETKTVA